ncbi:Bicupin, oxalate decarboxylase/oxidase [Byssothecium circinans]|uniref:Bicupin, oxalate decarboxylase/oxidase n=1 Tax=Byssothecium circinans TaxID=147558 RepID=A0A6A5TGL7_9PLEO|nr:Bicupin, oxalate decarboxylase/oxidase [Byssothecium circinans]
MKLSVASFILSLAPAGAIPAPQAQGRAATPSQLDHPGPPGSSGSLHGPQNFLGYSPDENVPDPNTVIPPSDFELAPGQSADPKLGLYIDLTKVKNPQPIRGGTTGPTDPGPRTPEYDRLNSDLFIPPVSDYGDVDNAKWPFGLSHNRHGLAGAGWARQQNTGQLPIATNMAGVNMRLSPNAYREMHWHKAGEWALMLNGSVRIQVVNDDGETFVDDVTEGDVWFFPAGIPHSIQAFEGGCEFLLVFDDGGFSEEETFLVSELMLRTPESVVAKNFRTSVDSFRNKIPAEQLWIFPGTKAPKNIEEQNVTGPAGIVSKQKSYTYHFSKQEPYRVPGGSVKIVDPLNFPLAKGFSAALVTIEPGAMREMHWHTTSDEWNYFLKGSARMTIYQAPTSSRTFDFTAGDVGYIPVPNAHYIENTGNTSVVFLEVLRADHYSDVSVNQWLGLTPRQIVKDHLHLDDALLDTLPKVKPLIVPGNPDMTTTNFTGNPLKE